jgi:adenylate kinase family enzyme
MQRVLIVGNSGSGKSNLARALGARLATPVIHLDALFWQPGWVESETEPFHSRVAEATGAPAWVADGNYTAVAALTMGRAETIVFLEQPRLVCLARVFGRATKGLGRTRADAAPGCPEKIDPAFWRYVWAWERASRPRLEAAIAEHGRRARLLRLTGDRAVASWLEGVPAPPLSDRTSGT